MYAFDDLGLTEVWAISKIENWITFINQLYLIDWVVKISIFYRSNKELAEVLVLDLWLNLSFFILKILIVLFTCNDGDTRVAVAKFVPVVFDFKRKFVNLLFTFPGFQEVNYCFSDNKVFSHLNSL